MTYEQNLTQMGLTTNESLVYDALLSVGKGGIKELLRLIPVKRANLYAVLYALKNKGLVVEIEEKGKKKFKPESPNKLVEMVEHEEHKVKQAAAALDSTLPLLISQYNLASGKPSIMFFEGKDGAAKIMKDSLTAKSDVLTYFDGELVQKYIADINAVYASKRIQLGILKRTIALDTPFMRERIKTYDPQFTAVRLIPAETGKFPAVMQIYDSKVSIITLEPEKMIGVLINNTPIVEMLKTIFELTWDKAKPIEIPTPAVFQTPNTQ